MELTLSGIKIEPKRWTTDANGQKIGLEWNTIDARTGAEIPAVLTTGAYDEGKDYITSSDDDLNRRFQHGHVYGGCYSSGYVNGNVVINIDGHLIEREKLFDVVKMDNLGEEESLYGEDQTQQERFKITERKTGVLLAQQGMDVLGAALNVFGGGKGKATEIWGNTTINLNRGYTFQIFGGSEEGTIGKPNDGEGDAYTYSYDLPFIGTEGSQHIEKTYKYNQNYSCYVNLCGGYAGVSKQADQSENMAECEFMYGGGFLGPICGNTYVNLGNGRIFNSFAGSCNADILGHTETYIGRSVKAGTETNPHLYKKDFSSHAHDADGTYYEDGFPWIRDYTYGGNDLGGLIKQAVDFSSKVRNEDIRGMVYRDNVSTVLTANAYTEYLQGRAEGIFGGCYGTYDYTDSKFREYFDANGDPIGSNSKPYMPSAFVNFRPTYSQQNNMVNKIYGAGQGYPGEKDRDHLQDYSYVLIDIPQDMDYYKEMEVFGAGAWSGVGMKTKLMPNLNPNQEESIALDHHSTIIDLVRGQIGAAYGGSYAEGITRRTVVNVPNGSTITIGSIFGGAYGTKTLPSCDVLDSNVEYHSATATLIYDPGSCDLYQGSLYGGNNSERRTLSAYVNVDVPVVQKKVIQKDDEIKGMTKGQILTSHGTVYGAGRGVNTWSEYTMVNLDRNAVVWEVYGGGQLGHVLNAQTVQQYMYTYKTNPSPDIDPSEYSGTTWAEAWKKAWSMDQYYVPNDDYNDYATFIATQLNSARARTELDDKTKALLGGSGSEGTFFNTNVIIHEGATVNSYAYGGGLGKSGVTNSGDVWGTTYIALLGGTVKKDLYAAGTSGGVYDAFNIGAKSNTNTLGFTASANAYIQGGTARNVYGGGWEGRVGKHKKFVTEEGNTKEVDADIDDSYEKDIPGETYVVIGKPDGTSFTDGLPAIERNAYGGGEGGAVFGTTNVTMRNGFIGYRHFDDTPTENTDLETIHVGSDYYQEKLHDETCCIFGGGYIDNSNVDQTVVRMYDGHVRNALFGGGEIAAVGRGIINASGDDKSVRTLSGIYKAGKTLVELYDGHVHRNVFGGGRGYNNLGEQGTLYSDGYVFGQTEVRIHGGEIGTNKELALDNGNVFGGGDIGYVYSAYELADGTLRRGIQAGARYDGLYEGYYYEHAGKKKDGTDEDATGFIMYSGDERKLTEDCKVLVEPHCKVKPGNSSVTFTLNFKPGNVISSEDFEFLNEYNITHPDHQVNIPAIRANVDNKGRVTATIPDFYLTFFEGEYVPTFALNSLGDRSDPKWQAIDANTDDDGVLIHNAVFAGGNTSSGSSKAFANATSVFGNATASIHDIYNRDLISIGTGREGGLYGDGNLTFVDGYRELNITNYGTDYYYLYDPVRKEITYAQYLGLLKREQDYYEVRYECTHACTDKDGTNYYPEGNGHSQASTMSADDILTLFKNVANPDYDPTKPISDDNKEYLYEVPANFYKDDGSINTDQTTGFWKQNGVCSIYAGRFMNTIQRADFCGVFGRRMVMQGAEDRVPEVTDYTLYTLNRVREVSLNKKVSRQDNTFHGNYFGIYSVVNFLGALTSDVNFTDVRTTENRNDEVYAADYDPTGATITLTGTTQAEKDKTLAEADDIDGVTVNISDETITATTVEALYKLRSVSGLSITADRLTDQTFYDWKALHHDEQKRNNGSSHNKVALASGVYLELTTEKSTGKEVDEKDWGLITGVVELDLINVQPGMGGGFVYAKNVHGVRSVTPHVNTTVSALNVNAITRWDYDYAKPSTTSSDPDVNQKEWQTSGNFVHSTQVIIDDCYNVSAKYMGPDMVPAHYWYIKGKVYVYDQYISAYTGVSNAYSETVDIPLTISAASNGTMTLLQVQPNKYAYKNTDGTKLGETTKLVINGIEYYLNDPINYWEWNKLTPSEKNLFVDETYVVTDSCKIGERYYAPGYVMLPDEYVTLRNSATNKDVTPNDKVDNPVKAVLKATKDANGNDMVVKDDKENDVYIAFDAAFHESNNLSHETGYMLTYKVNNPVEWNTWYTKDVGAWYEKSQTSADGYHNGPTFHIEGTGKVLGQRDYKKGDIITEEVYYIYNGVGYRCTKDCEDKDGNRYWKGETLATSEVQARFTPEVISSSWDYVNDLKYPGITNSITDDDGDQADFVPAMIMTEEKTVNDSQGTTYHLYTDHVVSAIEVADLGLSGSVADAYICSKSIQLSTTEFIYINTKMTLAKKTEYIDRVTDDIRAIIPAAQLTDERLEDIKKFSDLTDAEKAGLTQAQVKEVTSLLTLRNEIEENIVRAYYCTEDGRYGGNYYQSGYNYRGLEAFSSMTKTDRYKFTYNYDALDLLVDPAYGGTEGQKYQYDGFGYTTKADVIDVITGNVAQYSLETPVDYTATYNGSADLYYTPDEGGEPVNAKTAAYNELSRKEFESLPNERRHYAPITVEQADVTKNTVFYVVHKSGLVVGNTPYAVGSVLDPDDYSSSISSYVTELTFSSPGTYYYCRESYKVGEKGSGKPVKNTVGIAGYDSEGNPVTISEVAYTDGSTVPIGLIISEGTEDGTTEFSYKSLVNKQLNFTIHGKAPTETSTFYVSRFSDIKDLSTEKIITVVYRYDYEESDKLGNHITPISERHVVNIHITFKSGLPEVEDIKAPKIIIPGDKVGLTEPRVIPGANEIITGGWELYERVEDAENRANGIPYEPSYDPLYWYQNGYFVRYYCLTNIGGKSYSNYVPVSVANYHDLKKVMEAKEHHYYVDNPGVKRDSKIYIKDYSNDQTGSKNGLDLLKSLFDLSVLDNPEVSGTTGLITSDDFTGHKPLDNHVRAGKNLDFILRTDIDHGPTTKANPDYDPENPGETPATITENHPWTPIGRADDPSTTAVDESECFDGKLHGDGYHLSGLDHSLFAHLCGNVYNLGVSGSFTGGGIADEGDGYVENCWVMTTGSPTNSTHAIIGNPTDDAEKQIENCYYLNTNGYQTTPDARPMPLEDFYNGTVAYDLNGFYLHKRYYDNNTSWSGTKKSYGYLRANADGTLPENMTFSDYPDTYAFYPLDTSERLRGYVEDRYNDGDFRYAGGTIPDDEEIRMRMVEVTETSGETVSKPFFAPIWPDDYLFFGQTLSYGYQPERTHQDVPSSYASTNRVFRAPAYFRSYKMGVAHFNADAVFAKNKKGDNTTEAYKNMTAIDFTGFNDADYPYQEGWSKWSKNSQAAQSEGLSDSKYAFFPPLLDEGVVTNGLNSFLTNGLTPNLLAYTGAPATDDVETLNGVQKTAGAVSSYLTDASYVAHETNSVNHTVKAWDSFAGVMRGHWVHKSGDSYTSDRDHLLVDKEDFNAPMQYTFDDGHRMWHQRVPEHFVDTSKGWEAISLPFSAEIVTTNTKGEITHFYNGSYDYFDKDQPETDDTDTDTKVGHEYWLREYTGVLSESDPVKANFEYPAVLGDGSYIKAKKTVDNTFLWDYYYNADRSSGHHRKDNNRDEYQEYYSEPREYKNYPLLTNGLPYIIGFPGVTYYEFDLSGEFIAGTTAEIKPVQLEKQTITFASPKGTTIYVSDDEMMQKSVTNQYGNNGTPYTFVANYLNRSFEAGSNYYTLVSEYDGTDDDTDPDCSKFVKVPATGSPTPVSAFRPFFTTDAVENLTRAIIFGNERLNEQKGAEEHGDPTKKEVNGGLRIYTKKNKIYVESSLSFTEDVRVVTPAGITVAAFAVNPGQTMEVRPDFSGMYIVHTLDGKYTKKVAVRK